jgi:hypothetical protein
MRKTAALPLAFLSIFAAAIVAGCANGNIASTGGAPAAIPTPTDACTQPPGITNIQMVFPQNNAAAAPNLQGIVIAVAPIPLPTNWFFYSSSVAFGSTWGTSSIGFLQTPSPSVPTPTPLPSPSDTPLFPNPIYESASNGIFANSATTVDKVTIYLANASCYPGIQLSTFTTATVDTPTPTPTPT